VPQSLAPEGQTTALIIAEQDSLLAEFLAEHAVLFTKVLDRGLLLPIEPTGQRHQQEMPRLENHGGRLYPDEAENRAKRRRVKGVQALAAERVAIRSNTGTLRGHDDDLAAGPADVNVGRLVAGEKLLAGE